MIPARFLEAAGVGIRTKPARLARGTGAKSRAKATSFLETRFAKIWDAMDGPNLATEQMLVPGRKWRFDFSRAAAMVAIEIHGGVWSQGRHTRGAGFIADRRKMNAAQAMGWMVIELPGDDVTSIEIEKIVSLVRQREINLTKS